MSWIWGGPLHCLSKTPSNSVDNSCNSVLGPGATEWAGEERQPAKYGKGAQMWLLNSLGVFYIPEQTGYFPVPAVSLGLSCLIASVVTCLPICVLVNVYRYSQVLSDDRAAAVQVYSSNSFSPTGARCLKQISPRPAILTGKRWVPVYLSCLIGTQCGAGLHLKCSRLGN